jgi:alkanesulfonate monooxygenase SsuD/methylene tetrahydromethanopterin reductase-like flavin-dependent oxidoreductase (luciferase family)
MTSTLSRTSDERVTMYNRNALKIGFFGTNCSSGRSMTTIPERWSGSWEDNVTFARMADAAGMDFLLPIARWKGYGGVTDYQGTTFETISWATTLLAETKRMTIFGTVHAPLFHPLVAAKQIITADYASRGRIGLNVVCGWNEDEFDMFGVQKRDHEDRYRYGQEWLDVVLAAWERDDFDYEGEFFNLHGVREKPKPYGGNRPLLMNAGQSPVGRAFAVRNCDAFFTAIPNTTFEGDTLGDAAAVSAKAKSEAQAQGRSIGVYTAGVVVCRETADEARAFHEYVIANADWDLVDRVVERMAAQRVGGWTEDKQTLRMSYVNGHSGFKLLGNADDVAAGLAKISAAGFEGVAINFVNFNTEFPFFRDEVLPRLERLGVREPLEHAS